MIGLILALTLFINVSKSALIGCNLDLHSLGVWTYHKRDVCKSPSNSPVIVPDSTTTIRYARRALELEQDSQIKTTCEDRSLRGKTGLGYSKTGILEVEENTEIELVGNYLTALQHELDQEFKSAEIWVTIHPNIPLGEYILFQTYWMEIKYEKKRSMCSESEPLGVYAGREFLIMVKKPGAIYEQYIAIDFNYIELEYGFRPDFMEDSNKAFHIVVTRIDDETDIVYGFRIEFCIGEENGFEPICMNGTAPMTYLNNEEIQSVSPGQKMITTYYAAIYREDLNMDQIITLYKYAPFLDLPRDGLDLSVVGGNDQFDPYDEYDEYDDYNDY